MATVIKPCKCQHEFQDRVYGKGNRLHNERFTKTRLVGARCTVCSNKLEYESRK